ncbi:M23 family metallopeptidase [Spirochaeta cellobiosiphila]|uniref:M23 family metallopeptidase n=1 Tax=Spirochaeta cellobiosiphila TaxID=504483 RepID=UPI00040BF9BC|nr:M23 family metallopeptidase [Spirochaeta cellobiosiphila]
MTPNTPGSNVPSHGTDLFGETYAIDFIMIGEKGKLPYKSSFLRYLLKGLPLGNFYGWGQKIYSPVEGEVVDIENNIEERNPVNIFHDYRNTMRVTKQFMEGSISHKLITGNYVTIKISDKQYALLAHLKQNSIAVEVGQKVRVNDIIGELGHSGNSTMPHLHMQFMDSLDYKHAQGIPFVFNHYECKKKGKWIKVSNSLPLKTDIIRSDREE